MPPTIQSVSPPGVMPGSYFDLVIEGRNLTGAGQFLFLGQGVEGKIESVAELSRGLKSSSAAGSDATPIEDPSTENRVIAKVRVDLTAPRGRRLFRLLTPLGTTNIGGFEINDLPLTFEVEGNNTPAQAQEITLPTTINGQISAPDDVDIYSFEGKAGQPVVFEVVARALDSSLEAALRLDSDGRVVARKTDFSGADPVLSRRLPADGKYFIEVRDLNNAGGNNFFYRLTAYVSGSPEAGFRVPAGQERAQSGYGSVDSGPLTAPGTPAPTGPLPIIMTVRGAVMSEEGDLLRFSARKGQKLILEVTAHRTGSPLDSVVEVLDAEKRPVQAATARALHSTELERGMGARSTATVVLSSGGFRVGDYVWIGNELLKVTAIPEAQNPTLVFESISGQRLGQLNTTPLQYGPNEKVYKVDVFPAGAPVKPRGLPLFPIFYVNDDGGPDYGKDSRLEFNPPEEDDYYVRIRDVRGQYGPDYNYRLVVREPAPNFALTFTPANPNVPRGGRVPITVNAQRIDGFGGAIEVSILGLPPGLRATGGRIPPDQFSTTLALEADPGAVTQAVPFRVVGVSGSLKTTADPREAVAGNIIAEADLTPLSLVSVAAPPDITVTAEPVVLALKPSQQATAMLRIRRAPGFKARVPLAIANLPPGVSVKDIGLNGILINEDETSRAIEIEADPSARPIEQPIYALGIVETNSPIPQRQVSPPVLLRVLPSEAPDRLPP
ncbi:MAG: PPC domain-containing protein [Acidobacteria bacterium]|nr:PPC domain-containing protein [Acidobacteriota bacterium]